MYIYRGRVTTRVHGRLVLFLKTAGRGKHPVQFHCVGFLRGFSEEANRINEKKNVRAQLQYFTAAVIGGWKNVDNMTSYAVC